MDPPHRPPSPLLATCRSLNAAQHRDHPEPLEATATEATAAGSALFGKEDSVGCESRFDWHRNVRATYARVVCFVFYIRVGTQIVDIESLVPQQSV